MTVTVAIPIYRVSCRVRIDKAPPWSIVDELLMVSVARSFRSINDLAGASSLPRQLVLASLSKLMKFRLVESTVTEDGIAFRASPFGFDSIAGGKPLPMFPKQQYRNARFSIERAAGSFFRTSEIRLKSLQALEKDRGNGADVRFIDVEGDGPLMTQEANIARLSELVAGGWDEHLGAVVGRGANVIDNQYMVVRIIDGQPRGMPESAREGLRDIVTRAAASSRANSPLRVEYSEAVPPPQVVYRPCRIDSADILVGGSIQRSEFEKIVENADRRVIIHSTFLKADDVAKLMGCFAKACKRGVEFTIFWGAEYDDDTESRNAEEASKIMKLVSAERDVAGRFRIDMRTTGSHAKIMLADSRSGDWLAAIGSCNWLKSPFRNTEMTVLLRDQAVVGDAMKVFQRIIGRRGLSDSVANELELARKELRVPTEPQDTNAEIAILVGDDHDQLMRKASSSAKRRFIVGSHRLGSTARPGVLLPSQVAARPGVSVAVIYSQVSKPWKQRNVRELQAEAQASGVRLVHSGKIPLHGKFLAWDEDDLVVTSINWASASSDADFPEGEVGVHICSAGIAKVSLERVAAIYPMLDRDSSAIG
jgi:phosphatidylserine/phosphatidylglycerophosphate/cardiolipin synthase-like enzyme